VITQEAINRLKYELGRIITVSKMHHYTQGQQYVHLASATSKPKYSRLVVGNTMWIHTIPASPGAYSTALLTVENAASLREQYVVEHKILMMIYNDYLDNKEAGKDLILYAAVP
jgi:hypothetical protein